MSKLAEQVKATLIGERARIARPFNINMSLEPITDGLCTKYRFMAQFGVEYFIEDDAKNRSELIALTLRNVQQRVVEEVFGEFKQHIRELEHALYSRNYELAHVKVRDLERDMFNV